jgi:hypothetical protein
MKLTTGAARAAITGLLALVAITMLVVWLRDTAPVADTRAAAVPAAEVEPGMLLLCDDLQGDERSDLPAAGRATSGEVLRCPADFDGRIVTYVGEVVGDVLGRNEGSWVLMNDDAYGLVTGPLGASRVPRGTNSGLSVWLPSPMDLLAQAPGRAERRGDVLQVVGVVHRADPKDGGGLTVRADEVTLLSPAVELKVPLHTRQLAAAVVLAIVAGFLTLRDRAARRR